MSSGRQQVIGRKFSTRLIRKGALVEETYLIFQHWNLELSLQDNLSVIRETNPTGAKNQNWLREIITTVSSRFKGIEELIEPLILLSQGGFDIEKWKPCLLWFIGQVDEIYFRFATEWLYEVAEKGIAILRTSDVVPFVTATTRGRTASGNGLTDYGKTRAGRDLLRMAADFGLLSSGQPKRFLPHHLSGESFLFICHGIMDREMNARRLVDAIDWRLFLMSPSDVERNLFDLHQYRKVHYEVAGSISELKLPCDSLDEYARSLVR